MRLSLALTLAIAGGMVEGRPDVAADSQIDADHTIEARGLLRDTLDNVFGILGQGSSGETTTSSAAPTTMLVQSSTSASAGSGETEVAASSSKPSSSSSVPASASSSSSSTDSSPSATQDTKTYGNDRITTVHTAGTTGDKVGFKWEPVDASG